MSYMPRADATITFVRVSYEHKDSVPILHEASFVVRRGVKMTLMGQNGAGKSTVFGLITGEYTPTEGKINIIRGQSIALSRQVIPRDSLDCTVREFFSQCFSDVVYDIDPRIERVLEVVSLHAPLDRTIRSFSGGQQARLLLASALIQEPDILLLDEPTNNLDAAGIAHLTEFLVAYKNTCLVISHDADFLNAFTDGVLYLDAHTKTIEQYDGTYHDVVKEIAARVEKERRKNAQYEKEILAKKEKANFFAHKGGGMRLVAKRMRERAEELEGARVDVRRDDKTIRAFTIPAQDVPGEVLRLSSYTIIKNHKPVTCEADISLRRRTHLLLKGPNGIGKSTLLESLASGHAQGELIAPEVTIGYYRQDFSTLNFSDTVYNALMSAMERKDEQDMRSVAAGFLITDALMRSKVGELSEGQKGLVAFAQLVLLKPGLLILDEPTNHINFRHLPIIAAALDTYAGAMILVSHVPDFVAQIRIDEVLDLAKGRAKK